MGSFVNLSKFSIQQFGSSPGWLSPFSNLGVTPARGFLACRSCLKDVAYWSLAELSVPAVHSIWPEVGFLHCFNFGWKMLCSCKTPSLIVKRKTTVLRCLKQVSQVPGHSVQVLEIRMKNSQVAVAWDADHPEVSVRLSSQSWHCSLSPVTQVTSAHLWGWHDCDTIMCWSQG